MIELVENLFQLLMTGICTCCAAQRALQRNSREWALLSLFASGCFLGDLYWALFLVFCHKTPQYSYISDMSWSSSYLFLLLLIIYVRRGRRDVESAFEERDWNVFDRLRRYPLMWIVPIFTIGMCVFFMQWGDYIGNIISNVLMMGLLWHSASGLHSLRTLPAGEKSPRFFYIAVLVYCALEYALWGSSCFWMGDTITNVYFWIDSLISLLFLAFIPALGKAVGS